MKKLNESGQATLEYILILTVTVLIILSLVWQFNSAFKKYADAFFDGYIACLLETGELPGTGGDCSAEYQKFSIANGTPLIGGGLDGGGNNGGNNPGGNNDTGGGKDGSGSGGKDGKGGKSDTNKNPNGSGGSGSSGATVGSAGEQGGSSGSSVFVKNGRGKQRSTAVNGAKAAGAGNAKGREGLTALSSSESQGSNNSNGRRRKTAMDRSFSFFGQQDDESKALTAPSTVVSKEEGGGNLKPKKVGMDMTRKPAATASSEDQGFSLGRLVRIILIAAIIVVIVLFFGGQILQISKSAEK